MVGKAVAHIKMVINYWSEGLGLINYWSQRFGLLGSRRVSIECRVVLVDVLAKPRDLLDGPIIPVFLINFTLHL